MTNKEKSELEINSELVLNDLLKLQTKVRIIHGLAKNLLDFCYFPGGDRTSDDVLLISLEAICDLSAPKNVSENISPEKNWRYKRSKKL